MSSCMWATSVSQADRAAPLSLACSLTPTVSDVVISSATFHRRASALFANWAVGLRSPLRRNQRLRADLDLALTRVLALVYSLSQKKEEDASPLGEVDHLLVVAGNSDEENPYRKGSALQVGAVGARARSSRRKLTRSALARCNRPTCSDMSSLPPLCSSDKARSRSSCPAPKVRRASLLLPL